MLVLKLRNYSPYQPQHFIANIDSFTDQLTFTSAGIHLVSLKALDSDIFQPPQVFNPPAPTTPLPTLPAKFITAVPHLEKRIHPSEDPVVPELPASDPGYPSNDELGAKEVQILNRVPLYKAAIEEVKNEDNKPGDPNAEDEQQATKGPNDYGIVTYPLGTGSALPSKYRNGQLCNPALP